MEAVAEVAQRWLAEEAAEVVVQVCGSLPEVRSDQAASWLYPTLQLDPAARSCLAASQVQQRQRGFVWNQQHHQLLVGRSRTEFVVEPDASEVQQPKRDFVWNWMKQKLLVARSRIAAMMVTQKGQHVAN